jgi:hypothetical protein
MAFLEKPLTWGDHCVSPRLWIQRVALFSSFSPAAKFQEIIFTRGLNLIVGLDAPNPDREDDFGGHSVGKTTLCRLIRYCLGEPTFSTVQDQKLIKENFPQGWVGCELYLDGELWSVLLPFDRGERVIVPRAAVDETLEELFTQEKADNQYARYQQALESLVPTEASRADTHFEWRHLLAWLTRDQKCIQDNFWDWRTPESESRSPQHRSRKKEGEHLVRAVLGLLVSEENKLREDLSKLQERLNKAKSAEQEAAALPELHKNIALKQLANYCTIPGIKSGEPLPETTFIVHLAEEEKNIEILEQEYNKLRSELAEMQQAQKYWINFRIQQQNLLNPQKDYRDGIHSPQEEDPNLTEIKAAADKECLAAIQHKDCERIQEIKAALEQKQQGTELSTIMSEKEYQRVTAAIATIESRLREAEGHEVTAQNKIVELKYTKIPAVYKKLMAAYRRQDAQKIHWAALKDAWDVLYFNVPDTVYQQAIQIVKQLEEELGNKEMALSIARRENMEKAKVIAGTFDVSIKKVINSKCHGKFIAGDELVFSVDATKGELGGDALKVVRTVLGDFISMLYGIEGQGFHPGFLAHDSPRQADMSLSWYQRILTQAAKISEAAGGRDHATFQYIVTTTTAPPESLRKYVRKEFASVPPEMLLFKKRLAPLQGELSDAFDHQY